MANSRKHRAGSARQNPGDPSKTMESEYPYILTYLSNDVRAGSMVTATMLSHLFDLVMTEAVRAIESLISAGHLVRDDELGGIPVKPVRFK